MRSLLSSAVALALLSALSPVARSSSSSSSLDTDLITISSPPTTTRPVDSKLKWTYCGRPEFEPSLVWENHASIECLPLNTTVCYPSLGGGCSIGNTLAHTLQIKRVMTEEQPSSPTVWVVHDSILSKQTPEQILARFSKRSNASVYMVESRLFSNPPNLNSAALTPCGDLAANYTSSLTIDSKATAAVTKCEKWIEAKFGTNGIRAYSIDSAAQDLALAISATVGISTKPLFIYASGRGVRVVSRLLSQTNLTVAVAGVIYDSPLPTPHAEEPVGAAMTRFVSTCGDDPLCRDKFKGIKISFADMIKKSLEIVDSSSSRLSTCFDLLRNASFDATRDLKPSHGVRRFFTAMRKASIGGSQAIPPVLYRLKRCDKFDVAFLKRFFGKTSAATLAAAARKSPMVSFADLVTAISEAWPEIQSREQLVATFESSLISDGVLLGQLPSYCAFTDSVDASCTELYKDGAMPANATKSSSLTYQATKEVATKTDILVLASRLSAFGAGTAATQVYDAFSAGKTSDQTVVMVQSDGLLATELDSSASDSLLRLVDAFLTKHARGLNGKWHLSDLDKFALGASQPTAVGVVSSLDKASNISFAMTSGDSKAWFQQYEPYEGYKILLSRGGETDDSSLVDEGSDIPWQGIMGMIVMCGLALGLVYGLYMRCKGVFESCRPSAPPVYTTEPVPLPIQWNQPQASQWQATTQPQWPQPTNPGQWQGQFGAASSQQNQHPTQPLWEGYHSAPPLPPPTAPPMWPAQAGPVDGSGDQGQLIVQVHRL